MGRTLATTALVRAAIVLAWLTAPALAAGILRILDLNHERLTFYHNGAERRLTDVHGKVISDILV